MEEADVLKEMQPSRERTTTLTASVPGLTGCIQSSAQVTAIEELTIDFARQALDGCRPCGEFYNLSTTETATTYTWHFGDGTSSSAASTSHTYVSPGSYAITLEMETGGFCQRSLELQSTQNVEILPIPVAAIDVTPNQVDILNPVVWVEYLGDQNVDCYYSFGDGGGLEGCQGQYIYSDGGTFTITQTVVNEFGCANTAEGQVNVSGSVFYAPTAFTPDGDGLNDVWLPVVRGVSAYALRVTNRWGHWCLKPTTPTSRGWAKWALKANTTCPMACICTGPPTPTKSVTRGRRKGISRGALTRIGLFLYLDVHEALTSCRATRTKTNCTAALFGQENARISLT